jgi:GNAT superfamily N-acetyltransferase
MITIRCYEERDAASVGVLIAETYSRFNLAWVPPDQLGLFLGPFRYAGSPDPAHQEAIARTIRSAMAYVAEDAGGIVGILRGRKERLASLFVRGDHHRQGIGRRLVERFEAESCRLGVKVIRVAATEYAIPFYFAMGYQRSTGARRGWSFEGRGLPIQPMRKVLGDG